MIQLVINIYSYDKYKYAPAYQISQFCILLGFYPNAESEQILWNYFNYFRENLPNQPYQDGPLLGLIEIKEQKKERFLKRLQAKT